MKSDQFDKSKPSTMDGKFFGQLRKMKLKAHFPIDRAVCDVTANLDIGPSQEIFAIIRVDNENRLDKFHWGLVPFWAKDISIGNRMINARVESLADKPAFREAFKYRRCLIPADGFYEWTGQGGQKQSVFIALPGRKPFAFAGLWEKWQNKNDPSTIYRSCTIITTSASDSFRAVHHRMPAILEPRVYESWLDPEIQDAVALIDILKSSLVTELASFPVSKPGDSPAPHDSTAERAAGKPKQTLFDWPMHDQS